MRTSPTRFLSSRWSVPARASSQARRGGGTRRGRRGGRSAVQHPEAPLVGVPQGGEGRRLDEGAPPRRGPEVKRDPRPDGTARGELGGEAVAPEVGEASRCVGAQT